ncbi:MAG: transporter related protein, partial [Friedmanniella sp.]|nr:transporter related protein [Friedmanniella sp.]
MSNMINAERVTMTYGTRTLLDGVSLGLTRGDVIGVVGRNGDGKTTLLRLLTGVTTPDSGRIVRTGTVSIGYLHQADDFAADASVRDVIVGGEPDHVWASDSATRSVVEHLLGDVDLDALVGRLSGGERRRVALVALMLADHDLLVLDEPTNHLDVEAVSWLAEHLRALQARDIAMLVVSHDRWFLDAICTRIWEVHDGVVDAYDGGYAAYVLARAERSRQAVNIATRRKNLLRKELAWLRRGAPARTSKPKFRIDAANVLIENEPPPRDRFELQRFATSRLGKDVFDLTDVTASVGGDDKSDGRPRRVLLEDLTWSIGPGDRIGLVGVNGAGKTTLLRLLAGERQPDTGRVKQGKTLQLGHLSQAVTELRGSDRVLDSVDQMRRQTLLANGAEASASSLLEDFGFTGDKLTTRLDDLSGGERRRLQFLRLLLAEPNVLLLDEPTN